MHQTQHPLQQAVDVSLIIKLPHLLLLLLLLGCGRRGS
jgi:hypothetical protein